MRVNNLCRIFVRIFPLKYNSKIKLGFKMKQYLERIGIDQTTLRCDLETLNRLHRRHLFNVPFENLDIHWNTPIELSMEKILTKIIKNRRGGFCYELNGAFCALLNQLGFESRMVSARVAVGNGTFGPEFDHMAIISSLGNEEFIVDVGFGDFIAEP